MSVKILIGDVREQLRALPADHVDCVVTSPPYWGLRDYGVAGQIGLEPTLGEHLAVIVDVFNEVRRVMKPTATLWLNYGDCYATTPNGRSAAATLFGALRLALRLPVGRANGGGIGGSGGANSFDQT